MHDTHAQISTARVYGAKCTCIRHTGSCARARETKINNRNKNKKQKQETKTNETLTHAYMTHTHTHTRTHKLAQHSTSVWRKVHLQTTRRQSVVLEHVKQNKTKAKWKIKIKNRNKNKKQKQTQHSRVHTRHTHKRAHHECTTEAHVKTQSKTNKPHLKTHQNKIQNWKTSPHNTSKPQTTKKQQLLSLTGSSLPRADVPRGCRAVNVVFDWLSTFVLKNHDVTMNRSTNRTTLNSGFDILHQWIPRCVPNQWHAL